VVAFFNKIVKSLGRVAPDFYFFLIFFKKIWPSGENLPQKRRLASDGNLYPQFFKNKI
jgi:hypothetical protein